MARRNNERKDSWDGEITRGRIVGTENNERKNSWEGEITRGRIVGTEK